MHTATHRWMPMDTSERATNEQSFIGAVFIWICAGLLLTAMAAAWVVFSPAIQALVFRPGLVFLLFIVELVMVFGLSFGVERLSGDSKC